MPSKNILLRLTEELDEAIKELAKKDNRAKNNYILNVLEKHVQETKGEK